MGWEDEARKVAGAKGELSPNQASWGQPLTGSPLLSALLLLPNRRADQAGETEAHNVLLQPAALRGPWELHCGAAGRGLGAELRQRHGQKEGTGRGGPGY